MTFALALGPFHPALHGPQRLVVQVAGERVTDVDYQAGLNERGCADRLLRLDLPNALKLVARICGTCAVAHTLAFCQALEQLECPQPAPCAQALRALAAELERAASHLAAVARLLVLIGLDDRAARLLALREELANVLAMVAGARQAPNQVVPGGVRYAPSARERSEAMALLSRLRRDVFRAIDTLIASRALAIRTVDVGRLARSAVEQFGLHGPLARAAGVARDVRVNQPYGAYRNLVVRCVTQENGDVYARMVVQLLESFESVKLCEQLLRELPDGDHQGRGLEALPPGRASSAVEAPRGLLRYTIDSDGQRLTSVRIDAPRQIDRLLARALVHGALLDDVPLVLASVDTCLACAEQ